MQIYQGYHSPPQKISLQKFTKPFSPPFNQRVIPSLHNHISWDDEGSNTISHAKSNCSKQKNKPKRRKIFHHQHQGNQSNDFIQQQNSHPQPNQQKSFHRVKSNAQFQKPNYSTQPNTAKRLQEINSLLAQHRQQKINLSLTSSRDQIRPVWTKIEQQLTQSTQLIKKHQQVLTTTIPHFGQKIDANNQAISEMSQLLRSKFNQDSKNMENLIDLVSKNESKFKNKELQLSKINSQLLLKQSQLLKNKQSNKQQQLELIRLKRLQDLQQQNLQLYHSISNKRHFHHFEDLVVEENKMIEGKVWDDEPISRFPQQQESTIRYAEPRLNTSNNNTIGEILSPLMLNQYHY